jgi:hypothetical protein
MTIQPAICGPQLEEDVLALIQARKPWVPEIILDASLIPCGDMPGDKVAINPGHIAKAEVIFPRLLDLLLPVLRDQPCRRAVVAVCGGSGVGKSEIASLLTYYLNSMGVGSYTLSGDNYPHRIPRFNDAERLRIFRRAAVRGLLAHGQYTGERRQIVKDLQSSGDDYNPAQTAKYPWLACYQHEGRSGLKGYLGTPREIDFTEISAIIAQFKNGAASLCLKRMGREETDLWYDTVDFSRKHVLIIEWTHGNNDNIQGVDIPILLNSTPQETLEHRKARNRDGAADSPFTTLVLSIEQDLLVSQAAKAKLIVAKSGDILSYADYMHSMIRE